MNYKKEVEELKVNGFTFAVRIEGTLSYDSGVADAFDFDGKAKPMQVFPASWDHYNYSLIEVFDRIIQGDWVKVDSKLADLIYEAFIEEYSADELAKEFAEEPDFEEEED